MDDLIERLRAFVVERGKVACGSDIVSACNNSALSLSDLRALLGALEATREDAWQPIETAPRDGTEVIVRCYGAATEFVHIAWYRSKDAWEESGKFCGGWDSLEDWLGWWSYVRTSVSQEKLEGWHTPTHWRPLPAQPAIDQARGKEARNG